MVPLTVAKVGANSAYRFVAPFIATIASGLHVSLTTVGSAIAFGELVGLTAPLLSRLTARFARRNAICGGLFGIAASASLCASSHSAVTFAVGLALMNMSKIVFDLGVISWVTDRVAYAQIGRVLGITELAWAGGLFIGVVLMGLLTGVTSWRWGYVLAIVAVIVLATFTRSKLPAEPERPRATRQQRLARAKLGRGWWVIVGTMALTASAQALFVTFGKWLQSSFGFSDAGLAVVIFAFGGVELLGTASTVRFLDAWGKQRSVMIGAAVAMPCGLILALLHNHVGPGLVVIGVFIGAFEFTIVSTLSLSSSLIPDHPSTGVSFNAAGGTLGRALMAPIATAAYTHHGMWLPAVISSGAATVTLLCQWQVRTERRRRSTLAP